MPVSSLCYIKSVIEIYGSSLAILFTERAHHFAAVALIFALVSDSDLGQTQSTYESISFSNHFLFFLRVLVAANAHISAGSRLCPLLAPSGLLRPLLPRHSDLDSLDLDCACGLLITEQNHCASIKARDSPCPDLIA
jgi:hypothetical protein